MIRIALVGEFDSTFPPHQATVAACAHSAAKLGISVDAPWISTQDMTVVDVREFSALWITPGSPYKSLANTLAVIRYERR